MSIVDPTDDSRRPRLYNDKTSGLPGRRRVTPRACGARRCSIHPLHRAPRARHCCLTRAGPVPFLKIAPQASAGQRAKPVLPVRWPPCRFSTAYFVEIGNFAPFSEFLHIKGRNFPDVFYPFTSKCDPMNHEKFYGNRSSHRQTDAAALYIDVGLQQLRRADFIRMFRDNSGLKVRSTLATMSKQRLTLSNGRNFNAKLVRHCCRFWQQSRTLLRHCCWCGPGLTTMQQRCNDTHCPSLTPRLPETRPSLCRKRAFKQKCLQLASERTVVR